MFLIERPSSLIGLRADLAPRPLFGGTSDLIRGALVARPPALDPAASKARRQASQLDLALPQPTRRRKTG
jgi:hypothetical protein